MARKRAMLDHGPELDFSRFFTDRESESHAFAAALLAHQIRLDDVVGTEDSSQGRNLLVFHGHGGMGKSALSHRLQKWGEGELDPEAGWGPAPVTSVAAFARIDLHESQGFIDGAELLAQLRIQIGGLKATWPLFDLAFAAYWASTKPGEPLPGADDESGARFRRATEGVVGAVMEDRVFHAEGGMGLAEFESPALFSTLAAPLFRNLAEFVSKRLASALKVAAPAGYDDLFLECANKPSKEDPHPYLLTKLADLLAFEIDVIDGKVPLVVVFIDTFERLDADSRRVGEHLLNGVVWEMDNVLFVVTGRNRLTWWELSGAALSHRGPNVWPLLIDGVTGEPRQHRLEYLSEQDRRALIGLANSHLELGLSEDLIDAVADASGGLPEYIRLAAYSALACKRSGVRVSKEAVTGSLPSLVARLLDDLQSEEAKKATRAAAMFLRPTVALIAAAAGVDEGDAIIAVSGALFEVTDAGAGEFRMHDEVRAAIREAPEGRGGRTEADWRTSGSRALEHLRIQYLSARDRYLGAAHRTDTSASSVAAVELLEVTGTAIGLVCDADAVAIGSFSAGYPDWLTEAIVKGPSVSGLQQFLPASARFERGQALLDFVQAKSSELPIGERVALLAELRKNSPSMAWIAGRHLAYTHLSVSQWDDAISVFDGMLLERPDSEFVVYQRTLALLWARRFGQVRDAFSGLTELRILALRSRISFAHGKPREYLDWSQGLVRSGARSGSIKDGLENEGRAVRWAPLLGRNPERSNLVDLKVRAEAVGHDAALRDALLSQALRAGRVSASDERRLSALDHARNAEMVGYRTRSLHAAMAFAQDDLKGLARLREEIIATDRPRGFDWTPVEFLFEAIGMPLGEQRGLEWESPRERVAHRWAKIWHTWRERLI